MRSKDFIRVAKEVAKCPKCKNERIGGDEGVFSYDEHHVMRSCPCGFEMTYDVRIGTERPTVRRFVTKILKQSEDGQDGTPVFDGRVVAKRATFWVHGQLETKWVTQLSNTEGQDVVIHDATSPVGVMVADSKVKAIQKGWDYIERQKVNRRMGDRPS